MAASQVFNSTSLYVGDLAHSVTEGQLFDLFRNVGTVASIRVCRHSVTKESLGYAYVNFHNSADAERAIEQFNFTPIFGKPCRIMWSQRDPAKRKSGSGNIFIKNLDKSITNAALNDTFSAFGRILSCKVEVDDKGVSKGYGFVAYETQEEADKAIERVNGMMIADKIVFVGPFLSKKARGTENSPTFTNVYVKNLAESVTKDDLEKLFSPFGKVTSCAIMENDNNQPRGFGFVNFEKPEEAQAAVEKLNGTEVGGKQMYVGKAQKKQEREEDLKKQRADQLSKIQGCNVFVKNLDDTVSDEKLTQEFSRFGTINSVRVMRDEKGNSRGFGFVLFANPEDAAKAISETNGMIFGSKPLYASLAQRKEVRHAQLVAMHQHKMNMMQLGMMNGMRGPVPFPGAAPPGAFFPMGGPARMAYPPQMIPRPQRFAPNQPGAPQQQPQQAQQLPQQQRAVPAQGFQNGTNVGQRVANRPRNPRPPPAQSSQSSNGGKPRNQNAQGQQINKNYKYTATARNQPGQETPEELEVSKNNAGEQLYALILGKADPVVVGKITGMLLESLSLPELNEIIKTPALLDNKVAEALEVLQAHTSGVQVAPVSV